MTSLIISKPLAKPGQVILCVNMSKTGDFYKNMKILTEMGYKPELRHISLKDGLQVFAVLKDEQHDSGVSSSYLMDEWMKLSETFDSASVCLWRGYSSLEEAKAG